MSSTAVYLIGGPSKGTRMRPLTLTTPKPLFPLAGRPMIWHGIQALSKVQGLKEIILIGFYEDSVLAGFLKEVASDFPQLSIRYLREYAALGTAGGLYHFRDVILKGNPEQILVLHADVCCSYPLEEMRAFHAGHRGVGTIMGVKVARDAANKFGCIVVNPENKQAMHYVEKPESFLSEIINGGIYLFDKSIFDEIKHAMDEKVRRAAEDPLLEQGDELRLEQDVLAPMAEGRRLYVYQTTSFWRQIKTAGSAVPANALLLASYKTTNPTLLRQRSPTVATPAARPSVDYLLSGRTKTAEIVEPCFIDETAQIDPSAKIGPNVSIGAHVNIGYGCRVRDSILLDNVSMDKNSCVMHSIVAEHCKIGPWARVEGSPLVSDGGSTKQTITILAKDVSVAREVLVRSCIVLPSKALDRSFTNEVLL